MSLGELLLTLNYISIIVHVTPHLKASYTNKFLPRTLECVFLGYSTDTGVSHLNGHLIMPRNYFNKWVQLAQNNVGAICDFRQKNTQQPKKIYVLPKWS